VAGPTYSTKMTRSGLRMCDIFEEELFEKKLRRLALGYQKRFGDLLKYDVEEEIKKYKVRERNIAKENHSNRWLRNSVPSFRSTS